MGKILWHQLSRGEDKIQTLGEVKWSHQKNHHALSSSASNYNCPNCSRTCHPSKGLTSDLQHCFSQTKIENQGMFHKWKWAKETSDMALSMCLYVYVHTHVCMYVYMERHAWIYMYAHKYECRKKCMTKWIYSNKYTLDIHLHVCRSWYQAESEKWKEENKFPVEWYTFDMALWIEPLSN